MRENADPEIAAALIRRAAIFKIIVRLQDTGLEITPEDVKNAMRAEATGTFKPADYSWVDTTVAARLRK